MNKTVKTYAKRCISALLGAALSVGLIIPALAAKTYADVPSNHWANSNITYVTEKGLFIGTSDTEFSPERNLSRAMLTEVLYRYAGSPAVTGAVSYSDVSRSAYYANATIWAKENEIFDGKHMKSSTLDPEGMMPRGEFCVMLKNFSDYEKKHSILGVVESNFTDKSELSGETSVAMLDWAYTLGIIKGYPDNTLRPNGLIVRAEVAAMLERFDRTVMKQETVPVTFLHFQSENIPHDSGNTIITFRGTSASCKTNIGNVDQLNVRFTPENATDKTLKWASSNPAVATVDSTGKMTALSSGLTEISVTSSNGMKTILFVSVSGEDTFVLKPSTAEIVMSSHDIYAPSGVFFQCSVPDTLEDRTVTYSSSNPSVVEMVGANARPRSAGKATITATASNGWKATAEVTVTLAKGFVLMTDFKMVEPKELKVGERKRIGMDITPSNATLFGADKDPYYFEFKWDSSDKDVATVNNGVVIAKAPGTTTITATSQYGLTDSMEFTVYE